MKKISLAILLIILSLTVFYYFKASQFYQNIYIKKTNGEKKLTEKTEFNILILGYGGEGHDGPYLTDTMIVAHINIKTKKIILISIPRDIWVKIPTKDGSDFSNKINAVYQMELFPQTYPNVADNYKQKQEIGGLIKEIVSQIIGLKIDNFIAVDFNSFKKGIDILGGIIINVDKAFEDPEYPIDGKENDLCGKEEEFNQIAKFLSPGANEEEKQQLFKEKPELEEFFNNINEKPYLAFPCRYETVKFSAGKQFMNGETALKYVRSRHSPIDGGDFNRGRRQQIFIAALKDKIISFNFLPKIIPLMQELKENIKTDISLDEMKKIITKTTDTQQYTLDNLILSNQNLLKNSYSSTGQYILIPQAGENNWNEVKTTIHNMILGITPSPSPSVTLSPSAKINH
jgi:LCP family protein required for cell wall assembly